MSFCGHVTPRSDAPATVARMLRAVALGGERGRLHWAGDGVRLAAADGATLATGPGERVAMLDGHVHNRGELIAALGVDPRSVASDAALLLAAHARWGDDCADHVVGDYAFAIWEGRRRRMLMAVEPGGLRPLMFVADAAGLRIANEARGLLAEPDVARTLDATRMAHWLALIPSPGERTFFEEVRRVPPGGRAVWQDGTVTTDMWWRPERLPTLRLADHRDYAAAVRAALDEAVACRLGESHERVGSHLSGGLDSGGVTALAARRLAGQGRPLTAFTAVPARATPSPKGRFADEWEHAATVAHLYPNIDHRAASNDDMPLMEVLALREGAQDVPLLNLSNMVWLNAIERDARDAGVTILLHGAMGNMTLSYDGALLTAQLLHEGRWRAAISGVAAMRRRLGWPLRSAAGHVLTAMLGPRRDRRVRRALGRPGLAFADFSAIRPDFLDAAGLGDHPLVDGGSVRRMHPRDSRALRLTVMRRTDVQGEFATGTRRLYGIDTRDPTSDRRLTELCLTIPEEQFRQDGMPRAIARSALADVMPPGVVGDARTGVQAADWAYGFDAAVPALRTELGRQRASRSAPDWIDLDRIQATLDGWAGPGSASVTEGVAVTRALAAGRFVRRIEGGNA